MSGYWNALKKKVPINEVLACLAEHGINELPDGRFHEDDGGTAVVVHDGINDIVLFFDKAGYLSGVRRPGCKNALPVLYALVDRFDIDFRTDYDLINQHYEDHPPVVFANPNVSIDEVVEFIGHHGWRKESDRCESDTHGSVTDGVLSADLSSTESGLTLSGSPFTHAPISESEWDDAWSALLRLLAGRFDLIPREIQQD